MFLRIRGTGPPPHCPNCPSPSYNPVGPLAIGDQGGQGINWPCFLASRLHDKEFRKPNLDSLTRVSLGARKWEP